MGKGNDPNCAASIPMPEAGSEETFVAPKVDRVRTKALDGGLLLVGFEPGSATKKPSAFFTDLTGLEALRTAPDPIIELRNLPRYEQLDTEGPDILNEVAWELLASKYQTDGVFADARQVVKNGMFDPARLLRSDADNFYRPGDTRPVSRAYHAELWGMHSDLDAQLEALQSSPHVISAEIVPNPTPQNHEISGHRLLNVTVKLPQDLHDDLLDFDDARSHFGANSIHNALRYLSQQRPVYQKVREALGLTDDMYRARGARIFGFDDDLYVGDFRR